MNGYERIMNAIEGKKNDRVPVWPFVMSFSAKYANVPYCEFAKDYKRLAYAQIKTAEDFDLDAVAIDSDAYREASACGAVLDFPEDDLPIIRQHAILDKKDFKFKLPDISKSERLVDKIEGIRYVKDHFKNEKVVSGWIEAPLQSASTLYDLNEFMIDIYEEPEFIKDLVSFTADLGAEFAIEQAKAGADIIGIGDAVASMVSPSVYEEYIFPYTKKLVQRIREKSNVKLKYHICGDALHILKYAKEINFDVINIDYKIDMKKAFEIVGDTTCIKGNLDPVSVLQNGTDEMINEEVKKLIDLKQPKFILSGGCEITRDTPYKNMHTMVHAVK